MSATYEPLRTTHPGASTRVFGLAPHTDCAMVRSTGDGPEAAVGAEAGIHPRCAFDAFSDADADGRRSRARIGAGPSMAPEDDVRGCVRHAGKGTRREVP